MDKIELFIRLINKVENDSSWSTINQYINGVKFFHRLLLKSFDNPYVNEQILQFLTKHFRKPENNRRPLLKDEFESMICVHWKQNFYSLILRNLCLMIFAWIGFLRYDYGSQ